MVKIFFCYFILNKAELIGKGYFECKVKVTEIYIYSPHKKIQDEKKFTKCNTNNVIFKTFVIKMEKKKKYQKIF